MCPRVWPGVATIRRPSSSSPSATSSVRSTRPDSEAKSGPDADAIAAVASAITDSIPPMWSPWSCDTRTRETSPHPTPAASSAVVIGSISPSPVPVSNTSASPPRTST